ncbi:hypothetical protein [Nostoc sp.]|uniref:hypothetical protein n=1 Tax=Nostoc sp. TaxID=1180 RepID=UPI002FF9D7C2
MKKLGKQKLLPKGWLFCLRWTRSLAESCRGIVNDLGSIANCATLQAIVVQIDQKGFQKKIK